MPSSSSRRNLKKGGAGAADYMQYVVGAPNAQVAAPGSNVIAMQNAPSGYRGGARVKKGGSTFVDLAVPAVLLYTSKVFGKRMGKGSKSKKNYSRRNRSTRRRRA